MSSHQYRFEVVVQDQNMCDIKAFIHNRLMSVDHRMQDTEVNTVSDYLAEKAAEFSNG